MKPGEFITKETLLDKIVYYWMRDQNECCLWGIVELDTPLVDDIIVETIKIMIECVPIVNSKLKPGLWRGHWLFADPGEITRLVSRIKANDDNKAKEILKTVIRNPIEAEKPPVFRVISIDSPDSHYLVLQVHHLMMDGEGSKKLFELFAKIYRNLEKDSKWQPAYISNMDRSWFQITKFLKWHCFLLAPLAALKELVNLIVFIINFNKTASVIIGDKPGNTKSIYPEKPLFESIHISRDELELIKKNKKGEGAKINDYIMAALLTTVSGWNSSLGQVFSYVSTGYTANLRRWWGWPEGLFANMSVVCMVMAKKEDLSDVHKALKILKPKFDRAKKSFGIKELFDHVLIFMQPEIIGRSFGFLIPRFVKKAHALTNIGVIPDHAGDFGKTKAISYSLLAPPMASPNVLFTASGFRNSLTIHLNFNSCHMMPETAMGFLQQYKANFFKLSEAVEKG